MVAMLRVGYIFKHHFSFFSTCPFKNVSNAVMSAQDLIPQTMSRDHEFFLSHHHDVANTCKTLTSVVPKKREKKIRF